MTVSIRIYGNNNYWNAGPDSGSVTPSQATVDANSSSTVLNIRAYIPDGLITAVLQGNFQYDGAPSTMAHVSGSLTGTAVYLNGALIEQDSFTQSADLQQWLFPSTTQASYLYQTSILYQGINFVGSTASRAKWGDTLIGGGGKDSFTSYAGKITRGDSAYFDGKGGIDTAVFQGNYSQYTVRSKSFTDQTDMNYREQVDGYLISDSVTNRNGSTEITNVERLQFSDTNIALDVAGGQNAGMAYRMYKAALNRAPDLVGLGAWTHVLDNGADVYNDLAHGFVASAEFQARYGTLSTTNFVTQLYNNVLGRGPDADGLAAWVGAIDQRGASREVVLYGFSESAENISYSLGLIGQGMAYTAYT